MHNNKKKTKLNQFWKYKLINALKHKRNWTNFWGRFNGLKLRSLAHPLKFFFVVMVGEGVEGERGAVFKYQIKCRNWISWCLHAVHKSQARPLTHYPQTDATWRHCVPMPQGSTRPIWARDQTKYSHIQHTHITDKYIIYCIHKGHMSPPSSLNPCPSATCYSCHGYTRPANTCHKCRVGVIASHCRLSIHMSLPSLTSLKSESW